MGCPSNAPPMRLKLRDALLTGATLAAVSVLAAFRAIGHAKGFGLLVGSRPAIVPHDTFTGQRREGLIRGSLGDKSSDVSKKSAKLPSTI